MTSADESTRKYFLTFLQAIVYVSTNVEKSLQTIGI